ncbi:HlyD family type I secretion periplasmic adaptor subunit [Xanthobacter dioxanivorans]|uniref:Membrane fusion protein (MFP) family protein n=1 Tax=Xanthobacter dioxanivorans TaxID=2528964 RepID=A0A974PS63_9HYPH|nr:HlyD family type I secretion periplasmic adaptor subunit [Xanthobacter dioxanivorans]QRG08715.1 HlyD family type I secretion periplasmic adaptor subunit [Xanthobacter dioxanivorans]
MSADARIIPLHIAGSKRRRAELEFLPAALEIVETPPSPVGRAIAGSIIAFFLLALAWSWFGTIDIIATASGRFVPTGRTKVIQPFETGVVRAIHVKDGMAVKAGDVLIEIDPTASEADEKRLLRTLAQDRLDMARITALLLDDTSTFLAPTGVDAGLVATERRQMEEQRAEHVAKLAAIEGQIAQKQAERRSVQATLAKGEATLPMLRGQFEIRESLMKKGFGTKVLYLQAQQLLVEQEQQLIVDGHKEEEVTAALGALDRQKAEVESEYRKSLFAELAKVQVAASEHEQEAVKATQRRAWQTLTAPVDGTVQQLSIHTIGGVVTPAQQVLMIVPKDSRLEIEANLANRDVGFVQPGQAAEVKVEAFTFTRYGLLHGTVDSVSRDAVMSDTKLDRAKEADAPADEAERQARQPAYVARISVREGGMDTEQGFKAIEPGMAVTAEIRTGQRRIIEYLLSPLLRYRHDAGRER